MAGNRVPTLKDMAFDVLKKSQADYIKTNGFFSPDIFSISTDAPNQIQAATNIGKRVTFAIFLQAIIDNNVEMVKKCLDAEPELLLGVPDKDLVIESKRTWHKFYAEEALKMAVKRKQIKMIGLLLPYYDKLEQTEEVRQAKAEGLAAWKAYEIQKNAEGEDEIVIPKEYADYTQSLIDVFKDETFPNGVPGLNNIPLNVALSENTELALSSLLNILVPKTAVKLDEHIDEELLLLAIYKAYVKNFAAFNYNWNKLDVLCIRLMGLTQSALTPESGEIYCEGLDDVVAAINKKEEKEISPQAASHILKGGEPFYRESRDSRSGSGFDFLTGILGGAASRKRDGGCGLTPFGDGGALEKQCRAKTTIFWNITQQQHRLPDQPASHKQSSCVIL